MKRGQKRRGRKQYKSHMPEADSYVMLMYRLLFAHNTHFAAIPTTSLLTVAWFERF